MTEAVDNFNDVDKEDDEESKQEDIKNIMELKVTFLCIVFVGELAITGGEDGVVSYVCFLCIKYLALCMG